MPVPTPHRRLFTNEKRLIRKQYEYLFRLLIRTFCTVVGAEKFEAQEATCRADIIRVRDSAFYRVGGLPLPGAELVDIMFETADKMKGHISGVTRADRVSLTRLFVATFGSNFCPSLLPTKVKRALWSDHEDALYSVGLLMFGSNLKEVSQTFLPHRTKAQLNNRFSNVATAEKSAWPVAPIVVPGQQQSGGGAAAAAAVTPLTALEHLRDSPDLRAYSKGCLASLAIIPTTNMTRPGKPRLRNTPLGTGRKARAPYAMLPATVVKAPVSPQSRTPPICRPSGMGVGRIIRTSTGEASSGEQKCSTIAGAVAPAHAAVDHIDMQEDSSHQFDENEPSWGDGEDGGGGGVFHTTGAQNSAQHTAYGNARAPPSISIEESDAPHMLCEDSQMPGTFAVCDGPNPSAPHSASAGQCRNADGTAEIGTTMRGQQQSSGQIERRQTIDTVDSAPHMMCEDSQMPLSVSVDTRDPPHIPLEDSQMDSVSAPDDLVHLVMMDDSQSNHLDDHPPNAAHAATAEPQDSTLNVKGTAHGNPVNHAAPIFSK
jgi:hypothetical protein